jgi:ribosome maturation factor RimP
VEVVISASDNPANPVGPSVSALQICHRSMYDEFELREEELAVVTKFEIVVASPGIGEVLRTDQDFVSFKGFNVAVTTKEIYKKKTLFEGTLVERNEHDVCISLKGRIVKVPRDLVADVRLPKPKYESTDTEMRKLR